MQKRGIWKGAQLLLIKNILALLINLINIYFRHRQNFVKFMTLSDEEMHKVGYANVIELTKDI